MKTFFYTTFLIVLVPLSAFAQSAQREMDGFDRYENLDAMGLIETGQERVLQSDSRHMLKTYLETRWKPDPIYPFDTKQAEVTSSVGLKVSFINGLNQ